MTLVDFRVPGSNIFPGMSGKESDWSEGQLLRNFFFFFFFYNTFAHTGKEFTIAIKLILSDPYYIR